VADNTAERANARRKRAIAIASGDSSLLPAGQPLPEFLRAQERASKAYRLAIVLAPGFALMSFASIVEPFRGANRLSALDLYQWRLFGPEDGMVESNSGISVQAETIERMRHDEFDLVIFCAGSHIERKRHRNLEAAARQIAARGIGLAAVSTASFLLARAGVLANRRATVHWDYADTFAETFPDVELSNNLFVLDGRILTCAGATAALDLMLQIIACHHGRELSRQISGQFLHGGIRPAADDQRRMLLGAGVTNALIQRAVQLMEQSIEEPMTQFELARKVGVSQRQLERLCRRYLGATPARYYAQLRLERARRMLRQTELPIAEIAIACGFVSLSHFSKVYRRQFGSSPRADRRPI
jgi:transcriptional regulator GlxA family with amidase domain